MKNSVSKNSEISKTTKNPYAKNKFQDELVEQIINLDVSKTNWENKCLIEHKYGNLFTEKTYKGVNMLSVILDVLIYGYHSSFYGTFNQIKKAGLSIKKGSKSVGITFPIFGYKTLDGKKKITISEWRELSQIERDKYVFYFYEKRFSVFNLSHVNEQEELNKIIPNLKFDNFELEKVEEIVKKLEDEKGLKLKFENNISGFYAPALDVVTMPFINSYQSSEEYYSVLMHELIHWSGHADRLDRLKNYSYAFEEAVAEFGSLLIGFELGLNVDIRNSIVYIKKWYENGKLDKEELTEALVLAQEAVKHILY